MTWINDPSLKLLFVFKKICAYIFSSPLEPPRKRCKNLLKVFFVVSISFLEGRSPNVAFISNHGKKATCWSIFFFFKAECCYKPETVPA